MMVMCTPKLVDGLRLKSSIKHRHSGENDYLKATAKSTIQHILAGMSLSISKVGYADEVVLLKTRL